MRFNTTNWLVVASVLLSGVAHAGTEAPDLFANAIIGPQIVDVGTNVPVTVVTGNFGGAVLSRFTVEVVLTADPFIDINDVVVASIDTSFVGQTNLFAAIPDDLPFGFYQWGVRIVPPPEEIKTSNNSLLGLGVNVVKVDLALTDASPILVFSRITEPVNSVPQPLLFASNVGTIGTIVVYTTQILTPAPWISIDPPSNFAVAGQAPNLTTITLDKTDLPIGSYQTTIRFQNVYDLDDFEDVPITLTIGNPIFVPGDKIQGQIGTTGDTDDIVFLGLEGMKAKFKVKSKGGNLKPLLTLIDPDGQVETVLKFKQGGEAIKKVAKLKKTGEYRLQISGKNDTTGNYKIKSDREMPQKAKPATLTLTAANDTVTVLALDGAILDVAATPNESFTGPVNVSLFDPAGLAFDTSSFVLSAPGLYSLIGVPLAQGGAYTVRVNGFGSGPDEMVKVNVFPVQPKKQKNKIFLD